MNTARIMPWQQLGGSFEHGDLESAENKPSTGVSAYGTWHFIDIPSRRIKEIVPNFSTVKKEVGFGLGAIGEIGLAVLKTPQEKKIDPKEQEKKIIDFEAAKKRREQQGIELERARSERKFKEVMRLSGQPITQEQMANSGYSNTSFDVKNIDGIGKVCQIVDFRKWQMERKNHQKPVTIPRGKPPMGVDLRQSSVNEGGSAMSSNRAA